jgi:hypothetical protein
VSRACLGKRLFFNRKPAQQDRFTPQWAPSA